MAEEKKLYPYTEEELNRMGKILLYSLRPIYPYIIDLKFEKDYDERYANQWHLIKIDVDYHKRKKEIQDKYPQFFDESGWIINDEAYDKLVDQRENVKKSIRTILKIINYKTRSEEYDPYIEI